MAKIKGVPEYVSRFEIDYKMIVPVIDEDGSFLNRSNKTVKN